MVRGDLTAFRHAIEGSQDLVGSVYALEGSGVMSQGFLGVCESPATVSVKRAKSWKQIVNQILDKRFL